MLNYFIQTSILLLLTNFLNGNPISNRTTNTTRTSTTTTTFKINLPTSTSTTSAATTTVTTSKQIISTNYFDLCKSSQDFTYYHSFESDESKYIQCDPWGTYEIKSCEKDYYWNKWEFRCTKSNDIKNLTLLTVPDLFQTSSLNIDCNQTESVCLNNGICGEFNGHYKCVCPSNFTGEFCENTIDTVDIYHDILKKTFSIDAYKLRMIDENLMNNISYYEQYQDTLNDETYDELMNYLSYYNDTEEIRYDTLINTLVQDILRDIYPDVEFLLTFNASDNNMIEMIALIQNLLSYAKYHDTVYLKVFNEYEKVLSNLIDILNKKSLQKSIYKREAASYTRLTFLFLNQTSQMMKNFTSNESIPNNAEQYFKLYTQNELFPILSMPKQNEIKEYLKIKFNSTMLAADKLHKMFYPLQIKILNELDINAEIRNKTLGEMANSWPEIANLITYYDQICHIGSQLWDALVNYGFWHITRTLSKN